MRKHVVGIALFALGACDAPQPIAPDAPALQAHGPVVAMAQGGAQRIRADELWVMTFTAVRYADGGASGTYHVDRQDLDVAFDVDVTCLAVEGNTAWIGGVISKVAPRRVTGSAPRGPGRPAQGRWWRARNRAGVRPVSRLSSLVRWL